jgi:hypothetical protein
VRAPFGGRHRGHLTWDKPRQRFSFNTSRPIPEYGVAAQGCALPNNLQGIAMFKPFQFATVFVLGVAATAALAADPKATIADLDARLNKIGAPKVNGTDTVAGKTVPALFFGERKINNNYDVVDAIRKAHSATATVFVKDGDEFVRISTNVLTPEGKRGIGTQLARNAAYAAVVKGDSYCGTIDVLGTSFDACYNPVKVDGKVVAVTYVGHKK